jgi:hypothetical protein
MYATVRMYRGNTELADRLAERADEVRQLMEGIPGFRSYQMIRGDAGSASVTVCDDRAGAEESTRMAAEWLRENMPDVAASPPAVTSGEVVIETAAGRV